VVVLIGLNYAKFSTANPADHQSLLQMRHQLLSGQTRILSLCLGHRGRGVRMRDLVPSDSIDEGVAATTPGTLAAKQATASIPIVG
jgi:hypothetical protein